MASDVTRYALVPVEATAENGLKRALIGEFEEPFTRMGEDGNEVTHYVPISWTSIKCIYRKAVAASPGQGAVTAAQLDMVSEVISHGYVNDRLPIDVARGVAQILGLTVQP